MLLLAVASFIGNQACRPCHRAVVEAYVGTPMARSSGRVESVAPASFTAAGNRYRIEGNRLVFDGGSQSMDYYIGSNSAGRSFLSEQDGYLFEVPVTWYAYKQIWDVSPGFERLSGIQLNRAIEPSCLLCHSSRVRPVLGSQNRYGDPPFLDDGVACERCHGPGSEHVRDPGQAPMINPAGLEPDRRDSICSQCHLTGEARVERAGHRFVEFQAGERLADYATYLVWDTDRRNMKVTSHVEKLAESACKRAAGNALWCGTCHDPHTNSDKTQAACLGCHPAAHRAEERCATCHMPKSPVADDGGHGVMTDHSIPARVRQPTASPSAGNLKALVGIGDDRALGIAYAQLGDARARDYLLRAKPADAEVDLRLAFLERDPARAASLYESVLRLNPAQPVALVNLGAIYARAGRLQDAAKLWERALVANPAIEEAALNLALTRAPAEARLILQHYLKFNPLSDAARARLSAIR
jgi:Tfp pilus assembly protein PilF